MIKPLQFPLTETAASLTDGELAEPPNAAAAAAGIPDGQQKIPTVKPERFPA